jgi:preprotein translocase subunit SecF
VQAEKRDRARKRAEVDRYASVPAFKEDMPIQDEPGFEPPGGEHEPSGTEPVASRSPGAPEASGRGRVVPESRSQVRESKAAGRQQPSRQPRSKRGKK